MIFKHFEFIYRNGNNYTNGQESTKGQLTNRNGHSTVKNIDDSKNYSGIF